MRNNVTLHADKLAACWKSIMISRAQLSCPISFHAEEDAACLALIAHRLARRTRSGEVADRS